MRTTNTRPMMTAAAVGAAALLLLTGCSDGGTVSGTYFGGRADHYGTPAIIVVKEDTLTWGAFTCERLGEIDPDDADTSIGTLDDSRAIVAWTREGGRSKTDYFTESGDGSVITLGGETYSMMGTVAAKAILEEQQESCAKRAEDKKKRESAQTEQEAADARIRPAFDNSLDALFEAAESGNFSNPEAIFVKNGITEDEFTAYLYRNYNGLSADDLIYLLPLDPDAAGRLLEEYSQ